MNRVLQQVDKAPPFLCYYGAHYGRSKRPSQIELVKGAGMSHRTFIRLSQRTTWAGVTVKRMEQFAAVCGVDLMNPEPFLQWLAKEQASGQLVRRLGEGTRSAKWMVSHLNVLAAKAVMRK
jgi:hypothetical protein